MGCKAILERHHRVVAALTLTLGVNGPLPGSRLFLQSACGKYNTLLI